jgi:hypothetical protein
MTISSKVSMLEALRALVNRTFVRDERDYNRRRSCNFLGVYARTTDRK